MFLLLVWLSSNPILSLYETAVGAKLLRSCLALHVPMESPGIEETLRSKGFSGSRPSTWVIQVIKALKAYRNYNMETLF